MIVVCLLNVRQQLRLKPKDKEEKKESWLWEEWGGSKSEDRFFFRGVSEREIGEKKFMRVFVVLTCLLFISTCLFSLIVIFSFILCFSLSFSSVCI